MKKQKSQIKLFIAAFVALAVLVVVQNLVRQKVVLLDVPGNPGVSLLETTDNSLVCAFQDGGIISWDWGLQPQKNGDFKAASDRVIILDSSHLAAVTKIGKKTLSLYKLPAGEKQKESTVGWEDQDVWLRISPSKKTAALVRRNAPDTKGDVLYEFMTVEPENDLIGSPVTLSVRQDSEEFVDYALADTGILYAVGSKTDIGRIAAVDLEKSVILWDTAFDNTKEFCSVVSSPDSGTLYAGSRDGFLYKMDTQTGRVTQKIQLLAEGETRPITNDYSVLNTAFSPDGQYFVATIHPKVYILKTGSDTIVHTLTPADRLVSKIAFSPDNRFIATSDIRAGYPVKIWKMPQEE